MRSFCLLFIILSLVFAPVCVFAQNPDEVSLAQLKLEIQKLEAVDRHKNTPPEVRELNRTFLKKRRIELHDLLQKTVVGLRNYLTTLGPSLRPEEKLTVQNAIAAAEQDLQALTTETGVLAGNASLGTQTASISAPTTTSNPNSTATNNSLMTFPAENGTGSANGNGSASGGLVTAPVVNTAGNTVNANPVSAPSSQTTGQPGNSFNTDLNLLIQEKLQTISRSRVEQTDNTKQTDVPSASESSGSLVDQSSASDLIGLAANFAGLSATSNDNAEETSSVSVTASAYSLLAAIKRVDPLNPVFYDQNRNWRKFSVILGYDDEDQPDGTKQRAKIFGAKFMFINRRDPGLERNQDHIKTIGDNLEQAAIAFGDISLRARLHIFSLEPIKRNIVITEFRAFLEGRKPGALSTLRDARATVAAKVTPSPEDLEAEAKAQATVNRITNLLENPNSWFVLGPNSTRVGWTIEELAYEIQFMNQYLGPDYRQKLGPDVMPAVDEFLDRQLTQAQLVAFRNLNDAAREAVEDIRRAPQLSLSFTTKQRRIGIDEYAGTLIFDYGLANRVNLSLNGAYLYQDSALIGGDLRGFRFAGQLRFQLNRENLLGKKPLFFDVSTQGSWMNNVDAIYKAQGKLTIPIADGIDFPISVTYANRRQLIDEREVRGQFGFTVDTARLIRAFLFR